MAYKRQWLFTAEEDIEDSVKYPYVTQNMDDPGNILET